MDNKKPKKKRGRKPKKDVNKMNKKEINLSNNLVIKLNHVNEDGSIVEPYTNEEFSINEGGKNCGTM